MCTKVNSKRCLFPTQKLTALKWNVYFLAFKAPKFSGNLICDSLSFYVLRRPQKLEEIFFLDLLLLSNFKTKLSQS